MIYAAQYLIDLINLNTTYVPNKNPNDEYNLYPKLYKYLHKFFWMLV